MSALTQAEAEAAIYREARMLDEQRFEEWLDLFVEDVLYWMPAWKDDTTLSSDPDRELSLVYYRGKQNLRDRVDRLRSGLSPVSRILPRVVHSVTNVMVDRAEGDRGTVFRASSVTPIRRAPIRFRCISGNMSMGCGERTESGASRARSSASPMT